LAWQGAGGFGGAVESERLFLYLLVSIDKAKIHNSNMIQNFDLVIREEQAYLGNFELTVFK
jgi:hypothetical protein